MPVNRRQRQVLVCLMSTGDGFLPVEINPRDAGILWQFHSPEWRFEHQLDVGFQAVTAGQFSNAASRNGVLSLPITPCASASATPDRSPH